MKEYIEKQQAIDAAREDGEKIPTLAIRIMHDIKSIPAADVVPVVRCKDCKWWDKYSDTYGYCLAAKHGYWSKHWDIRIRRTYDADWYCADAERREGGH